jgi:hypothetical protein
MNIMKEFGNRKKECRQQDDAQEGFTLLVHFIIFPT